MKRIISAAITAAIAVFLIPTVEATVAGADTCPPVMNFAVGGTGDPTGVHIQGVPPGARTNIQYPASIAPVGGSASGDESVRIGTERLSSAVSQFRDRCPGSHINVVGHSLGAVIVSDVCDRIDGRNTTCYTTGNPKRQGGGIMGVLPTFIPGFTFSGERVAPAGGPRVVEVCNQRDLYCNAPDPTVDPVGFVGAAVSTLLLGHHSYPDGLATSPAEPHPAGPDLRVVEPVMQAIVPDAPIRIGGPYVPTPVEDFLPPAVASVLPPVVREFVPPPLPRIPGLP